MSVTDIFEDPLGQDNVESFVAKLYRGFAEVNLEEVRGWILYGYINAVVVYVCRKKATYVCWPSANVQKTALPASSKLVYDSYSLNQPIVWLDESEVLLSPELLRPITDSIIWGDVVFTGSLIHSRILG